MAFGTPGTVSGQKAIQKAREIIKQGKADRSLRKWQVEALCALRDRMELNPHAASFGDAGNKTAEIAETTRLWRESWILPLIDALIQGDREKAGYAI